MDSGNSILTDPLKVNSKDEMNNEISSTSDDSNNILIASATITKFNEYYSTSTIPDSSSTQSSRQMNSRRNSNDQHNSRQNSNDRKNSREKSNDRQNSRQNSIDQPNLLQNRYEYSTISTTSTNNFNTVQNELNSVQNSLSNMDLNQIQIPIVGYEVMEERARFTIFKLKVEDRNGQSWLVFRRYTDFVRLYSRMKAENPNINLPLPGKRWFRDNYEPMFLEERVRGLQIFVNSILRRLPNHRVVREFFCLDEPPQMLTYQPEVQAVYAAMEDSISSLKTQLKQKDSTILHLQHRLEQLESMVENCQSCSSKTNRNS